MAKVLSGLVEGLASAAASRNYLSTLVGATGVVVALGVIDSDTAKGVVDAAQQIMDGLGQMVGGAKKMYVLLLPVASVMLAKYAGLSATLKGRLTSITNDPNVKIEGKITVPADVAAAVPSSQVVAKLAAMIALLICAGMLTFDGSARASDLPAPLPSKAQATIKSALFNGFPYQGSGFYFGLNTIGGGGTVAATGAGVNPNSVVSNEAGVGLTVGYSWANATGDVFYAVEAMFDARNFNGNAAGLSFSGPASFEQRFKIGTPLSKFLSVFPGGLGLPAVPPFPALPNGAVATNVHPYLMAGLHEDDVSVNFGLAGNQQWRVAPSVGVGAMGQLTNGVAIDAWVETVFPTSNVCIGPVAACGSVGQQVKVGLGLYY